MILPLILGTAELAAKLAPIVAQAVVDVVSTVHDHLQEKARGLPVKVVLEQRRQAALGASHGTVAGPPVPATTPSQRQQDMSAEPPAIWPRAKPPKD